MIFLTQSQSLSRYDFLETRGVVGLRSDLGILDILVHLDMGPMGAGTNTMT